MRKPSSASQQPDNRQRPIRTDPATTPVQDGVEVQQIREFWRILLATEAAG